MKCKNPFCNNKTEEEDTECLLCEKLREEASLEY